MKKTIFIKNAVILTVSSLILRFIGIIFKVWLANTIGSEGIGLYQIVFSVYVLASTFATSGICTAVTRLIADEIALGSKNSVKKILSKSIVLTLLIALFSTALLYFGAGFISLKILNDKRAIEAIKILSLSLPFMGISSCIRGYFIARRKVTPNAVSQIFEQIVRIAVVFFSIKMFASKGIAKACFGVLLGDTVAELCAVIMLMILYFKDINKLKINGTRLVPSYNILGKIRHIALPITLGRYLNTALRTSENILVPKNLAKYPLLSDNALSMFGMIKGMALPILFFPSTLLNSISTLMIPEISEATAKGRKSLIKSSTEKIITLTSIISMIFACVFLFCGKKIGLLIYKSEDVGFLLTALSPIVPFMYLDSVCDGLLKGLDQQVFAFRTSVIDSLLRIILVLLVLPFYGIKGFIGIMYISNFLTCMLNVGRLVKMSNAKLNFLKVFIIPLLASLSITSIINLFIKNLSLSNLVYIILLCAISVTLYFFFILSTETVKVSDYV